MARIFCLLQFFNEAIIMDSQILLLLCMSFVWAILFVLFTIHWRQSSHPSMLPPGPRPYPIIGNILELLGTNPLDAFTHLSKSYGPIMTVKLGSITTIVISSPKIAKEAFHTHDLAFSSRKILDTIRVFDHDKFSMAWMPASSKWRTLRRACATKIFSTQQLNSTQFHRKKKVQELLNYVNEYCMKGEALDFGEAIFKTVLNSISNTFFSMDLFHYYASDKSQLEFKEILLAILEEVGRPNVSDIFPFIRLFDLQGARARMTNHFEKLLVFFDGVLDERIRLRTSESKKYHDVLDSFLDLIEEESSQLSRHDLVHLFGDLFGAAIDTTTSTLEWAMAELLHNPRKLVRVREELQHMHGKFGQVEESHISKLPYLQAVVKETLRLHPPAPLLVPHMSNDDVELGGFIVPKNAQVLVNIWLIGRDSSIWTNPNLYEPERFLESDVDFKGQDFEFIPFGAGRRICPGLPLASRTMHYMLASLLHHFNWKLADELKPEDMSHKSGITLHKAQPLRVIPIND